jgi:chromosome partitioning protein
MARIIAIANQKGGTAKSTTTISLGSELARLGKTTLLVDMDPQGHLAEGFGLPALALDHELSESLVGHLPLESITQRLRPNLYLAPTNLKLAYLEPQLMTEVRREDKLKGVLESANVKFDIILIDCPPSIGILTVNAFSAAQEILVPMAAEFFAVVGVSMLLDSVMKMRRQLNPQLEVTGIVPTRVTHTRHATDVVEQAKRQLSSYRFFTSVPEAVAVRDAAAAGQPITEYAPHSKAAEAYRALAKELLS